MIKSMTGFGHGEFCNEQRKFTVELKSVNHRYLDLSLKLPKSLSSFDAAVRQELRRYITRGKVDVYVTMENLSEKNTQVIYNRELASRYLAHLRTMAQEFGLEDDTRVSTIARLPEVFTMEEEESDQEELWLELKSALDAAAEMFVKARVAEGANLKRICAKSWTACCGWWTLSMSAPRRSSPSTGKRSGPGSGRSWEIPRWTRAGS